MVSRAELKEILKDIGLTENESRVYLTLLSAGSCSANVIAEKSSLHRQAVYDALERLMEKGFANFITEEGVKKFSAYEPQKIIQYLQEKKDNFSSILPALANLQSKTSAHTNVEVYKGKASTIVRTVYRDVIEQFKKKRGKVLISGTDESKFLEADELALAQHLRRIRELNCKERIFVLEGDTVFVEGSQTEYRWIPKKYFNPTPTYVYGDKIAFIIWGEPNYAIIIENKQLADANRRQFNLLWEIAKKIPKKFVNP